MPKKGYCEEQIVAVLRQVEAGERVADISRKVGISQPTYYLWKSQYAGLGVSELRELRQLREENGRLKRLVADTPASAAWALTAAGSCTAGTPLMPCPGARAAATEVQLAGG